MGSPARRRSPAAFKVPRRAAGVSALTVVAASDDDMEFSFQVKKAAEGALIACHFGWDEAGQREYHANEWRQKRPDVILLDGSPIGTIRVRIEDGCMHIGQFFILPEYQGRGLGTRLLAEALLRADAERVPARLAFLEGNRAESLYRRFGFEVTDRQGKLCYMERPPRRP